MFKSSTKSAVPARVDDPRSPGESHRNSLLAGHTMMSVASCRPASAQFHAVITEPVMPWKPEDAARLKKTGFSTS
jgi:hypothetical protein